MIYFFAVNLCCADRLTFIDMIPSKENSFMMNIFDYMELYENPMKLAVFPSYLCIGPNCLGLKHKVPHAGAGWVILVCLFQIDIVMATDVIEEKNSLPQKANNTKIQNKLNKF